MYVENAFMTIHYPKLLTLHKKKSKQNWTKSGCNVKKENTKSNRKYNKTNSMKITQPNPQLPHQNKAKKLP